MARLPDHRDIGTQQELFTNSKHSPGSPLFLPDGAHLFNKLVAFLRVQYRRFGFQEVLTPTIYKKALWETSGHWENYRNEMFAVTGRAARRSSEPTDVEAEEAYGLKPMNCPGHCLLYKTQTRGWRSLPVRFAEFGALHRDEVSGALSGLTRVRRFHQDDGHIFCRPDQVAQEIASTLDLIGMVYRTFKLPPFKLVLSTRPEQDYVGTVEEWDRAEEALSQALAQSGHQWTSNPGDGAFYGPKIDVILSDNNGKEHQTATVQLDFQLPQRFGLEFQSDAGLATPVIIHRAVLGSLERFLALLMEHYQGRWPFWLSPRQAIIVTVTNQPDVVRDYAHATADFLSGLSPTRDGYVSASVPQAMSVPSFIVDVDDSDRSLSKKVSEAKRKGYSFIMVVGAASVNNARVEMDIRAHADQGAIRPLLDAMVGARAVGDGGAVSLSREQVYHFFCTLSDQYD
ncbi:MAG: hypothetical protein M1838_001588 [Thelocarpon superellum]|nr:MAG: hypothetical protein M1838_001588 [Thelocarpon superellum]